MTQLLLNIDVPDIAAAGHFYVAAFELSAARRFGTGIVELSGWPVPVYLIPAEPGIIGAAHEPRRYPRHRTRIHADIIVDDLSAALSRAVAAGASVERPITEANFGKIAVPSDPFGLGFCLIRFSEQGYDSLL
jgi:predicted enzyme related to lactoylglutathione lyase